MSDLYGGAGDQQQKTRRERPTRAADAIPEVIDARIDALVVAQTDAENPVAVFTDERRYRNLYGDVERELRKHVPDVTTEKGRKAIAANAFRATKVKTTLVKHGNSLTEEQRQLIKTVNAARDKIEEELTALAKELRRPLTEWEEAEDARTEANQATVAEIRAAMIVTEDDTSATVEARGRRIHAMEFPSPQWTDAEREIAEEHQADAVASLLASRARLAKQEQDAAELEQLRAEAARQREQEEADRIAREEREAEEAAQAAAEEARQQAAREEEERIAAAAQRAADEAREEAEAAAKAEQDAKDQAAADALEEQRRATEAAETEAQRLRDIETERQRQADAAAEEQRKREANKRHRQNIETKMRNALLAVEGAELMTDQADSIVRALVDDRIPNTKVTF